MRRILLAAILITASNVTSAGDVYVPVHIGDEPELDACGSDGQITSPNGAEIAVRAGPALTFRKVDSVANGQTIFICSTSYDKKWLGVVYSKDDSLDCGVATPVPSPRPYDGPCKSGWVPVRWVKIIAG